MSGRPPLRCEGRVPWLSWLGSAPSLTVAPGGGVKPKTESSGVDVDSDVNPTSNAGDVEPRAKTWTRVGMRVAPSIAIRTEPISERGSRGTRFSWYAGRPATVAVGSVVTRVLGLMALRAAAAACCGVIG